MRRKAIWFGTVQKGFNLTKNRPEPRWPDIWRKPKIETEYPTSFAPVVVRQSFPDVSQPGCAVALHPLTDFDCVKIYFDGDETPEILTPGIILRRKFQSVRAEPADQLTSTRGSYMVDRPAAQAKLPLGQAWQLVEVDITGAGDWFYAFKNIGAAAVQVYNWNGAAWVADGAPVAVGATFRFSGDIAPANRCTIPTQQACDFSPIGPNDGVDRINFADLCLLGLIGNYVVGAHGTPLPNSDNGVMTGANPIGYAASQSSEAAVDNNGNPGQGAIGPYQTPLYYSPWFHPIEACWANRCGLIVFDEIPPSSERVTLAPERRYSFIQIQTPTTGAFVNSPVDVLVPLVVVPTFNCDRATFTWKGRGNDAGLVRAQFGFPGVDDAIDRPGSNVGGNWINSLPMWPPASVAPTNPGYTAVMNINEDEMLGPLLAVLYGKNDALNSPRMADGAELVLRRKFIG